MNWRNILFGQLRNELLAAPSQTREMFRMLAVSKDWCADESVCRTECPLAEVGRCPERTS